MNQITNSLPPHNNAFFSNLETHSSSDNIIVDNVIPILTGLGLILSTAACCYFCSRRKKVRQQPAKVHYLAEPGWEIRTHQKETKILMKNRLVKTGGKTSGALRYPQLILELMSIKKELSSQKKNLEVLILGPGLIETQVGQSSPNFNEILAAFPKDTRVTVVDCEPFVREIGASTYGSSERSRAKSVLSKEGNMGTLPTVRIKAIENYIDKIPNNISQHHVKIVQENFEKFNVEKKYDYIFAIQSLMYACLDKDGQETTELLKKYLGGLRKKGIIIIDRLLYSLMQNFIQSLPSPDLQQEIRWEFLSRNYKIKHLRTCSTNTEPAIGSFVRFTDELNRARFVSTTDIYKIERL